jgi:hypothetical protein
VAITNGYTTLAFLRVEAGIEVGGTTAHDAQLERAIEAASRQIDNHCGRRFWQDGSVVAREFYADDSRCCFVDDISTTTDLVVKVDEDDDGTFETTLTITTNFIVLPTNAADEVPVRPFTELRVVDSTGASSFPVLSSGRPGVQVTAKFGWPAVPDDVEQACVVQALQLFKAPAAPFGGIELGDGGGVIRVRQSLNPIAEALLEGYSKPRVA